MGASDRGVRAVQRGRLNFLASSLQAPFLPASQFCLANSVA